jgi:CheY-like chemotaxis protein
MARKTEARSVAFIHWNAGEARHGFERLRQAGYTPTLLVPRDMGALRPLFQKPPDVIVLDLSRRPSDGRALATLLRQRKAMRHVPIVFADGEADKVQRVRTLLPDAVYTEWSRIRSALRQALRQPVAAPAVPDMMGAYAGTPLVRKLGIRSGMVVALLGAPPDFAQTLAAPSDVQMRQRAQGRAQLILLFVKSRAELSRRFPAAARALAPGGSLWIVWPKKASGVASDLNQVVVRRFGMARGFVDYKISSIDATWSGLRFARRTKRPRS